MLVGFLGALYVTRVAVAGACLAATFDCAVALEEPREVDTGFASATLAGDRGVREEGFAEGTVVRVLVRGARAVPPAALGPDAFAPPLPRGFGSIPGLSLVAITPPSRFIIKVNLRIRVFVS